MKANMTKSIALLLLFATLSFASTNGGTAGAFARMGAGARAKAMGNAQVALADGPEAIYFNPGALSFLDGRVFCANASQLALDRSLQYLAFATSVHPKAGPQKKVVNAGVGVSWLHAGVSDIDSRSFDGEPLDMIDMSSNLFMLGFGLQPHPKVGIGVTAKLVYESFGKISDNGKAVNGDGFGVDAGIFTQPARHLSLGAQFKDIGTKTTWNTTDYWSQGSSKADKWPLQYRVGAAYENYGVTAAVDFESSEESETSLHAGVEGRAEISEKQSIAGRVGVDRDSFNIGGGLGFALWKVQSMLDMTYVFENTAPDNAFLAGWKVAF